MTAYRATAPLVISYAADGAMVYTNEGGLVQLTDSEAKRLLAKGVVESNAEPEVPVVPAESEEVAESKRTRARTSEGK